MSFDSFINLVKGDLTMTPSGPVAVFYIEDRHFTLSCTSNNTGADENSKITWELPLLNFAELLDPDVINDTHNMFHESFKYTLLDLLCYSKNFKRTTRNGQMVNDLPSRAQWNEVTKDGTSILTVSDPTEWDQGYYTCRSGKQSIRIYIFPKSSMCNRSNINNIDI